MDVAEKEDTLVLRAELPGIDPKDVEVSVTDDMLTIRGEKRAESKEDDGVYHRMERRFGSFSRNILLPCRINADQIEAHYEKGILVITMPKCGTDKTPSVKIKVK
jgi:HSP20 family protein